MQNAATINISTMTLFLRNKNNRTVLDLEIFQKDGQLDISSSVIIDTYSELLLESENKDQTIGDFKFLSDLRGWYWESYVELVDTVIEKDAVKVIKDILVEIGNRHNLRLVQD